MLQDFHQVLADQVLELQELQDVHQVLSDQVLELQELQDVHQVLGVSRSRLSFTRARSRWGQGRYRSLGRLSRAIIKDGEALDELMDARIQDIPPLETSKKT